MPSSSRSLAQTGILLLTIALSLGAILYIGEGLRRLVLIDKHPYACDLNLRWRDGQYLIHGLNPADPAKDLPGIECPNPGYPPWSHTTALFLVPPFDFDTTQVYFAVLNVLALVVLGRWAYRTASSHGTLLGFLSAASALALVSILYCLSNGQYGIVVMALVIVSFSWAEKNQQVLAGLAMGLALVKPHIGGLFMLIHFFDRRWITVAVASLYLAIASAVAGGLAQTSPLTMLKQGFSAAGDFSERAQNLVAWGAQNLFGEAPGTLGLTAAGAVLTSIILLALGKRADLLMKLSICAVISMFWCYRKQYDCILLGFLVVSVLVTAIETRAWWMWAMYVLMGLSVWVPLRMKWASLLPVQAATAAIWVIALVLVCMLRYRASEAPMSRDGR